MVVKLLNEYSLHLNTVRDSFTSKYCDTLNNQTGRKWTRTASTSLWNKKFCWTPDSIFQWCFFNLTRPSGRRGNFYQLAQGQHPLSCAPAESLSCPKSTRGYHNISGSAIFKLFKTGGCPAVKLLGVEGGFRRNLLIASWATPTAGCTRVQLIFQEIDTVSSVFCAHSADLLKSCVYL
jgi:hypothetical protein